MLAICIVRDKNVTKEAQVTGLTNGCYICLNVTYVAKLLICSYNQIVFRGPLEIIAKVG